MREYLLSFFSIHPGTLLWSNREAQFDELCLLLYDIVAVIDD